MSKIYLCYTRLDLGIAKKIYEDLKRYGLNVWFDIESLLSEHDWKTETKKAIQKCDFFIMLASSHTITENGIIHPELKFSIDMLNGHISDTKKIIVPVRLDKCDVSDIDPNLGQLSLIDIFPKQQYYTGFKKMMDIINPGASLFRSKPTKLIESEIVSLIKKFNFFDTRFNKNSSFKNNYKLITIKGENFVVNHLTLQTWQQGGSIEMDYENAHLYIDELNKKGYAGYSDWRLPTIDEAMSLLQPRKNINDLYIDAIFDNKQTWIWTADTVKGEPWAWIVNFENGSFGSAPIYGYGFYVRAVRSHN